MSDAVIERQARSKSGFIRAYGMFWSANEVDWTGATSNYRLEILGRVGERRPRLEICNFWEQRGIYVLYNDYSPYYVGRTSGADMSLGKRLRQHYEGANGSPHRGKLERFSWFGWRGTLLSKDTRGMKRLRSVPRRLLNDSESTIRDIESLLIYSLGTKHVGNGREETFTAAVRWTQVRQLERETYLRRTPA